MVRRLRAGSSRLAGSGISRVVNCDHSRGATALRDNPRTAGSVQDEVPTFDANLVIILLPAALDRLTDGETTESDTSEHDLKPRRWLRRRR